MIKCEKSARVGWEIEFTLRLSGLTTSPWPTFSIHWTTSAWSFSFLPVNDASRLVAVDTRSLIGELSFDSEASKDIALLADNRGTNRWRRKKFIATWKIQRFKEAPTWEWALYWLYTPRTSDIQVVHAGGGLFWDPDVPSAFNCEAQKPVLSGGFLAAIHVSWTIQTSWVGKNWT